MRRLVLTVSAAGLAAASVLAPASAHAVPGGDFPVPTTLGVVLYGDGDPIAQGCSDAYTVSSKTTDLGTIELRWSNRCSANWARFTPRVNPAWMRLDVSGTTKRAAEGARYPRGGVYSNMIVIPSTQWACAKVDVWDNDRRYVGGIETCA